MNEIEELEQQLKDNTNEISSREGKEDFENIRVLYLKRSLIKDQLLKAYRSEYVSRSNTNTAE